MPRSARPTIRSVSPTNSAATSSGSPASGHAPASASHRVDRVGHHVGQRRDPLMMEGRLRHPPQPSPGRPFGRHQALADDHLGAVVIPAPRVVLRVVEQDVLDVVGVRDQVEHQRAELVAEDVAVLFLPPSRNPSGSRRDRAITP